MADSIQTQCAACGEAFSFDQLHARARPHLLYLRGRPGGALEPTGDKLCWPCARAGGLVLPREAAS